jgi:hypothetical protein
VISVTGPERDAVCCRYHLVDRRLFARLRQLTYRRGGEIASAPTPFQHEPYAVIEPEGAALEITLHIAPTPVQKDVSNDFQS